MTYRKPISVALSAMALAGFAALATGAATPASAQTVTSASTQAVTHVCDQWGRCYPSGGYGYGWQQPVWQQPVWGGWRYRWGYRPWGGYGWR